MDKAGEGGKGSDLASSSKKKKTTIFSLAHPQLCRFRVVSDRTYIVQFPAHFAMAKSDLSFPLSG